MSMIFIGMHLERGNWEIVEYRLYGKLRVDGCCQKTFAFFVFQLGKKLRQNVATEAEKSKIKH